MVQTSEDIRLLNEKIDQAAGFVTRINAELSKVIVGQQGMIERLLIGNVLWVQKATVVRTAVVYAVIGALHWALRRPPLC